MCTGPWSGSPMRWWSATRAPTGWWWSASTPAGCRWPGGWRPPWARSRGGRSRRGPSTCPCTGTTAACGRPRRPTTPSCRSTWPAWSWSWSTTCSTPAGPCGPPWTRSPTSAGRGPSSWPCWSTAATVSCPCGPTTSARTCPPPPTRRPGSSWPSPTAPTAWSSRTRPGRRWRPRCRPEGVGEPQGGAPMNKHLLSAADLSAGDITRVLDTAAHLAKVTDRAIKKVPTLRGRTVCNLFFEDSTRTRISFELAAKRLSADVINFSAKGSSVSKGESLKDTAITLEAMGVDAIVMRHGASGAPWRLAEWVEAVVVNAGDGTHEHPTQALLDLYTMRQRFPSFDGLKVAIVGDVLHSRVARSNVLALTTLGAEVTLVAPPTLLPARVETWGAAVSYDLDA